MLIIIHHILSFSIIFYYFLQKFPKINPPSEKKAKNDLETKLAFKKSRGKNVCSQISVLLIHKRKPEIFLYLQMQISSRQNLRQNLPRLHRKILVFP